MATTYNEITGQSLERLAALSDGIFAVAMTLLVLDLHVSARELIHSQGELSAAHQLSAEIYNARYLLERAASATEFVFPQRPPSFMFSGEAFAL